MVKSVKHRTNRNKIEIFFVVLNHLAENSPERKTNLANVARVNYRDLQKHLEILRRQELVRIVVEGEDELLVITDKGRSMCTTMMIVLEELGSSRTKLYSLV
ncbi:MAG: putative transcriptional regulator [Candidatus Nitrosomirales archaeon]|jgi:predicted transcriptional regulator